MDHQQRVFQFACPAEGGAAHPADGGAGAQKVHEFKSKKYNFKLEQVLIDRFGKDVLDDFSKTHNLNFNLNLEHVRADLPKLLENVPDDFDWTDADYDAILDVYFFFISYKENALLRQVQSEKEILAFLTAALAKDLDLTQTVLSKTKPSTPTPYS